MLPYVYCTPYKTPVSCIFIIYLYNSLMGICNHFYKYTISLVILLTYFDNIISIGRIHDIWMIRNIVLNNILQLRINIWQIYLLDIIDHSAIPPHKTSCLSILHMILILAWKQLTLNDKKIVVSLRVSYWSSLLLFCNCSKKCLTCRFITIWCWNNTKLNNMFILLLIMGQSICSI